jgi:hypothetical protein
MRQISPPVKQKPRYPGRVWAHLLPRKKLRLRGNGFRSFANAKLLEQKKRDPALAHDPARRPVPPGPLRLPAAGGAAPVKASGGAGVFTPGLPLQQGRHGRSPPLQRKRHPLQLLAH